MSASMMTDDLVRHTNQQMHSIKYSKIQNIKYNSWQISNSSTFRHRSAFFKESTRTKVYKSSTLSGYWSPSSCKKKNESL